MHLAHFVTGTVTKCHAPAQTYVHLMMAISHQRKNVILYLEAQGMNRNESFSTLLKNLILICHLVCHFWEMGVQRQ